MGAIVLVLLSLAPQSRVPRPATVPRAEIVRAEQHARDGWARLERAAYEAAVREFSAAIRINPNYADALHGLGKAYMALHRYDLAVRAYERCRAAYEMAGSSAAEQRTRLNRAREDRLRDLRQELFNLQNSPQPLEPDVLMKTVRELQTQIRDLQGQREPGPAIEAPGPVPAFLSLALGSAYFRVHRLDGAERMFREAVAVEPRFGEAHSNLGLVLLLTGRPEEAQRHVEIAEEAGFPVNPELKRRIRDALR